MFIVLLHRTVLLYSCSVSFSTLEYGLPASCQGSLRCVHRKKILGSNSLPSQPHEKNDISSCIMLWKLEISAESSELFGLKM